MVRPRTEQASACAQVELESGGNVRLEDGRPSDVWYSSCLDLLASRFLAPDFSGTEARPAKLPSKATLQSCPAKLPCKAAPQSCPAKLPRKSSLCRPRSTILSSRARPPVPCLHCMPGPCPTATATHLHSASQIPEQQFDWVGAVRLARCRSIGSVPFDWLGAVRLGRCRSLGSVPFAWVGAVRSLDESTFAQVAGLRVVRVTRIHNRFLRARFESRLEQLADVSDASHKRALEYLFYGESPQLPGELLRAAEEGFRRARPQAARLSEPSAASPMPAPYAWAGVKQLRACMHLGEP